MSVSSSYNKEILLALLGFSIWTFGDAAVRYLNDFPVVLIAFISNCVSVGLMLIFSKPLGGLINTLTMPQLKLRLLRGALLACSGFLSFIVFTELDLATAYALIFLAPFMAKILSIFVTGENIRLRSWAITTLGFIGVLIVLRPGVVPLNIGVIAALLLACLFAGGYVMARYIKDENQTLLSMGLFQYSIILVCSAYPAYQAFQGMDQFLLSISFVEGCAFFVSGLSAVIGSVIVAKAFSNAPTQTIAPIHYVQMVWGVILGAFLFSEIPDLWTVVGSTVIVISGLLLIKFTRPV